VVVETVGRCPAQERAAVDAQIATVDFDPGAKGIEPRGDPGDPVRFLVPKLTIFFTYDFKESLETSFTIFSIAGSLCAVSRFQ